MNVLEHYILEVYEETPIKAPYFDKSGRSWVKVEFKCDCYGTSMIVEDYYPVDEWNEIKERGYYIG